MHLATVSVSIGFDIYGMVPLIVRANTKKLSPSTHLDLHRLDQCGIERAIGFSSYYALQFILCAISKRKSETHNVSVGIQLGGMCHIRIASL